jgi:hypothetical protein
MHYILNANGEPELCEDVLEWGRWMEHADRHVAFDVDEQTGWRVSTVFLGLDHNFGGGGPPILWETMVFGGPLDGEMDRYSSVAEAKAGHQAMCAKVTEALAWGTPDSDHA